MFKKHLLHLFKCGYFSRSSHICSLSDKHFENSKVEHKVSSKFENESMPDMISNLGANHFRRPVLFESKHMALADISVLLDTRLNIGSIPKILIFKQNF